MATFRLDGRSLYIDGQLRQIGEDDTIFCPKCHEPILYWQVPFSSCYANEPMSIEDVDTYETGEVIRPVIREVTLRLDAEWFEHLRELGETVEDGETFEWLNVREWL
jgi:hypothetical protein